LTLFEQSRVAATQDQVSCDLAGEAAILNLKNGVYYGLNPVGARVWSMIQEPRTFAELRKELLEEFDVAYLDLDSDLRDLLGRLTELGLIEVTP
jgi:hypothetical protein